VAGQSPELKLGASATDFCPADGWTATPARGKPGAVALPDQLRLSPGRKSSPSPELRPAIWAEEPDAVAAGLVHDLRNLLSAIGIFSDLLLRTGPLSKVQAHYAQEIHATSDRGMDMVRQFMPGMRRPRPVTFSAGQMLREMRPLLEKLVGDNIELRIDRSAPRTSIFADRLQMERVVLNLAANARDAMPQGGKLRFATGTLELSTAEAANWPGTGAALLPGRHVVITVADTGCGMDAATLATAFKPFYTTKESRGIGLGLAIVQSIVARHGGNVAIQSAPGRGTSVRVVLPAAPGAATARQDRV
jgi:signal transduction histidine kinase